MSNGSIEPWIGINVGRLTMTKETDTLVKLAEPVPGDRGYVSMSTEMHNLRIQVAELTHSLKFAAGQLSTDGSNLIKHPETVFNELIEYGKKAQKED